MTTVIRSVQVDFEVTPLPAFLSCHVRVAWPPAWGDAGLRSTFTTRRSAACTSIRASGPGRCSSRALRLLPGGIGDEQHVIQARAEIRRDDPSAGDRVARPGASGVCVSIVLEKSRKSVASWNDWSSDR